MNSSNTKSRRPVPEVKTGLFSKQEGAEAIINNVRHVHSSILGLNDPCWKATEASFNGTILPYPWELSSPKVLLISQSQKRSECIEGLVASTQFGQKSQNRERLKLVTEELLSNSFYHAYKNQSKQDKYERLSNVTLAPGEEVKLSYAENRNGLHLVVEDQGGSLTFEDFRGCFSRCFFRTNKEFAFDEKHSGAGLGLYLIYGVTTHLSIQVEPGKKTRFSVWLAQTNQFDPDSFSFNFFEE